MDRQRFFSLVLLTLTHLFFCTAQIIAAEDATLAHSGNGGTFVLPEGWTETPSGVSNSRCFRTSHGAFPVVCIRNFELPHQTALEWATDEAKALERQWSKPVALKDNMQVEGFSLVTPATEMTVGSKTWATIVGEWPITYQGMSVRQRTEQYFRKDGDVMVEVAVSDIKEQVDNTVKREVEQFLSSVRVKQAANASTRNGLIPADRINHLVYVNVELGFSFEGPKGWSGFTQRKDEHGKPVYKKLPPGVQQMFIKEYPNGKPPGSFFPWLELQIAKPQEGKTPTDMLRSFLQSLPPEDIIAKPAEVKLGGRVWITAEYQLRELVGGTETPEKKKAYLLAHKGAVLRILGTSTVQEYGEDRVLFDEAVSKMKFSDDLLFDFLKDEAEKKKAKDTDAESKPVESSR